MANILLNIFLPCGINAACLSILYNYAKLTHCLNSAVFFRKRSRISAETSDIYNGYVCLLKELRGTKRLKIRKVKGILCRHKLDAFER